MLVAVTDCKQVKGGPIPKRYPSQNATGYYALGTDWNTEDWKGGNSEMKREGGLTSRPRLPTVLGWRSPFYSAESRFAHAVQSRHEHELTGCFGTKEACQ